MKEDCTLIIDGLNLFTRHFVVNPTMNESGSHIGGVVGFMKALQLLSERFQPKKIAVCWEGGGSARRRAIFPDYKKGSRPAKLNRYYEESEIPDTYENRNYQISLTISLLKNLPIVQIYVPDCEADDVVAYLVNGPYKNERTVVVSSDKDLYQLINEMHTQWSPGQKKEICKKDVLAKFGISPENICAARAFVGDSSDGIPGVPGAGFKTMAKRFPQLSLDEPVYVQDLIDSAKELSKKSKAKIYMSIAESEKEIIRNWKVMTLDGPGLSAHQIQKIENAVNTFEPRRDKMSLMRQMIKEGIKDFDINKLYMAICATC